MKTPYDGEIETTRLAEKRRELLVYRQVYLACLQSPEVTALVKALEAVHRAYLLPVVIDSLDALGRLEPAIEAALAPWKEAHD